MVGAPSVFFFLHAAPTSPRDVRIDQCALIVGLRGEWTVFLFVVWKVVLLVLFCFVWSGLVSLHCFALPLYF